MSRAHKIALAAVGATLYFLLVATAGWNDSATYDEPTHILSGYLCLEYGRFDVNNFHPPLCKLVAAVPLLWTNPSLDLEWLSRNRPHTETVELAGTWFWNNDQDPQSLLRACRTSLQVFEAVLLFAVLGLLLTRWDRRRALLFFLLAPLHPPFLGLSIYTVTDVVTSLFLLLSLLVYSELERHPETAGRWWALLVLCLSGGLSSKHSFLLVPAVLLVVGLVRYARSRRPQALRHLAATLLATGLAVLATLALYGWCMRGMEPDQAAASMVRASVYHPYLEPLSPYRAFHPLGLYVSGLGRTVHLVETGGELTTNFLSETYRGGRSNYFPLLMLAKENPVVLALTLFLVVKTLRSERRRCDPPDSLLVLSLILAACYLGVAFAASLNIGFRHLLPAYICLLLAVSSLTAGRDGKILLILAVARLVSLGTTYPHYLGYFNALAGGVQGGYYVSVISDADWSQDLLRLRQFAQRRGYDQVFLFPASYTDACYYLGDLYVKPNSRDYRSGDLVAVSTTYLQIPSYLEGSWRAKVEQARSFPVEGQIGGSLVVFRVP